MKQKNSAQHAISPQLRKRLESLHPMQQEEGIQPLRAEVILLEEQASVHSAAQHILLNCLSQMVGNEAAVLYLDDPEGVHQMRIGLRRLRAAFKLFRKSIPRRIVAPQLESFSRLLELLGEARDWDVFIEESLLPIRREMDNDTLVPLIFEANGKRAQIYRSLRSLFYQQQYNQNLLTLVQWVENGGWLTMVEEKQQHLLQQPVADFAHARLQQQHQKIVGYDQALEWMGAEQLHQLRIEIKKQRYAAEFLHSLYRKRQTRPYQQRLKRLQDSLGIVNDITTAHRLLERLPTAMVDGALRTEIEQWLVARNQEMDPGWREEWSILMQQKRYW